MNSMKIQNNLSLTQTQQRFAADNHYIVEQFLNSKNLSFEDYYDAVIFTYLSAVRMYFKHPELHEQSFQAVASRFMNFAVQNHRRNRMFEKREANTVSLNIAVSPNTRFSMMKKIPAHAATADNTEFEHLWMKIKSVITPKEASILHMRVEGYTDSEIAKRHRISLQDINSTMLRIQESLKDVCVR